LASPEDYLASVWFDAQNAPLDRLRSKLVAHLVVYHLTEWSRQDERDILEVRETLRQQSPALNALMGLCFDESGYELEVEALTVPIEDYGSLALEDFMVSLYNSHQVQRLMLHGTDGYRQEMILALREGLDLLLALRGWEIAPA
jgi:hypothetical protein